MVKGDGGGGGGEDVGHAVQIVVGCSRPAAWKVTRHCLKGTEERGKRVKMGVGQPERKERATHLTFKTHFLQKTVMSINW